MRRPWAIAVASLWVAACARPGEPGSPNGNPPPSDAAKDTPTPEPPAVAEVVEGDDPHRVIFADRISQAYLLLTSKRVDPSREELQQLLRERLSSKEDEPELALLLELVAHEPPPPGGWDASDPGTRRLAHDVLGLHLEALPLQTSTGPLISPEILRDEVLTRDLSEAERKSVLERRHVLVLRADYRNQYAVRGLRLLQTLVRIAADEYGALVHDPDTGETMGVDAFTRRRFHSTFGNVSEQIAVVPFDDPRHGEGFVRLTTRGMRRFGSVDLELDALPREPAVLQAATHLLHGLAYQMVKLGEFDRSGYAVELDQVVTISYDDVRRAYESSAHTVTGCRDCPRRVDVHLVERASEPHDPQSHVVARVVAPREESDAADYDQATWVRRALADLLGQ